MQGQKCVICRTEMSALKSVTAIDLFAGAGGMSLGLIQAGIDVRAAVEFNPDSAATYWFNLCGHGSKWIGQFPKKAELKLHNSHAFGAKVKVMFCCDIKNLSGSEIVQEAGLRKGQLHMLTGGPPCQGFSTSNVKRCVEDPRSQLMWQFLRMVREINPKTFTIENVPGLLSFKDFVNLLMESLESYGYQVRINILNAVSYGVPQFRRRIFIEGTRNNLHKLPSYPVPSHFDPEGMKSVKATGASRSDTAEFCFAKNGFTRHELRELWWNEKLGILMNKKTAADQIEQACSSSLARAIAQQIRESGLPMDFGIL